MAKSPKTNNNKVIVAPPPQQSSSTSSIISNKNGSKELKSILKEPKKEPRREKLPAPAPVPTPVSVTKNKEEEKVKEKKEEEEEEEEEKEKEKEKEEEEEEVEDDDDYYHDLFFDIVNKELPEVNNNAADGANYYPYDHLQDDMVCVLAEIYENSDYLVIPDIDMVQKIAKLKIKDPKLQNEFIFGTDNNIDGGIYSVIKKYTDPIRKSQWDELEKKYSEDKEE